MHTRKATFLAVGLLSSILVAARHFRHKIPVGSNDPATGGGPSDTGADTMALPLDDAASVAMDEAAFFAMVDAELFMPPHRPRRDLGVNYTKEC